MANMEDIRKTKEKHEAELMKKSGVTGCAIGYKQVEGLQTDELCLVCFVKQKLPEEKLNKKDIIPKEIQGIPTDVVESGSFQAL